MSASYQLGLGANRRLIEEFMALGLTAEPITEILDGVVLHVYWTGAQVLFEPVDPAVVQVIRTRMGSLSGAASPAVVAGLCHFHLPGYRRSPTTINRPGSALHGCQVGSLEQALDAGATMLRAASTPRSALHPELTQITQLYTAMRAADNLGAIFAVSFS